MVAWPDCFFRGANPVTSSSIPSAANPGSKGVTMPAAASSASARWMAVSWAWRRVQNASGEGAGRNVAQARAGSADVKGFGEGLVPGPIGIQ